MWTPAPIPNTLSIKPWSCFVIEIEIPGFIAFRFKHLVLDVNGTIAKDGQLIEGVAELLKELRSRLDIHLITADTHGKQEAIDRTLDIAAVRIAKQNQIQSKLEYVEGLGAGTVVAVGNGANDSAMLERAALGIAILGPEGAAVKTLCKADIAVPDIRAALELLLYPKRLIATLRR
jgi:P-type E1-E2 ATPase